MNTQTNEHPLEAAIQKNRTFPSNRSNIVWNPLVLLLIQKPAFWIVKTIVSLKLNLQTYSTLLKVAHNKARLNHLLNLFDLSTEELCEKISQERVNPITPDELLQEEIKVSYLKKIDKVFNQGIYYYLDPSSPSRSKTASVFFRKKTFHTTPNLETRRRVMEFEGLKHSLAAIEKLSEQKTKRHLPIHSVDEDAAKIGKKLQEELVARVPSKKREYLKTLITALSSLNIYVF